MASGADFTGKEFVLTNQVVNLHFTNDSLTNILQGGMA